MSGNVSLLRIFDRYGKVLFAVMTGVILVSEILAFRSERFYVLLLSGSVGFIAATLVNTLLKGIFGKKRPSGGWRSTGNLLDPLALYSFPSYHTQLAFTMSFIGSWFSIRIHWIFPVILGLLAFLTAYTRYAVRAHDSTDIAGGGVIGVATAVPICFFLTKLNSKPAALVSLGLTMILFLYIPHREFTEPR